MRLRTLVGCTVAIATFTACSPDPPTTPPPPLPNAPAPAPVAPAPRLPEYITVSERIQFETNKAILKDFSKITLNEVVRTMKENPQIKLVEVGGHTDSDGTDDDNLLLSENRAKAVIAYLISQGIEPHRLKPRGFGETVPVAKNDTVAGKAANRRVEFRIVDQGQ